MRKTEPIFSTNSGSPESHAGKPDATTTNDSLSDIRVTLGSRELLMLGGAGPERELSVLPHLLCSGADAKTSLVPGKQLPVLLGSGLGHALEALVQHLEKEQGPDFQLAVVDRENDILALTGLRERYARYGNILWVSSDNSHNSCNSYDSQEALRLLSKWQFEQGGLPFFPVVNPFYLRLDREYYSAVRDALVSSASANFWDKAGYAKFKSASPRILLITSKYFLIGELEAACKRMGIEYQLLKLPDQELAVSSYLEQLLHAIVSFKPDFALTINHLGVDREGVLQDFLARVKLPLASWFVDNPHLVLYSYDNLTSPWTAIFTWDVDNLDMLRDMGFEHVFYLPLGTDHIRFAPPANKKALYALKKARPEWVSEVSFVGNSMLTKVRKRFEQIQPPPIMADNFRQVAAGFGESDERFVSRYLEKEQPEQYRAFVELNDLERQLGYEAMLTWEATLQYRLSCVAQTLPFNPLFVGDKGWFELLADRSEPWRYFHELTYYTDLPKFYPLSDINFNCTSKQMKGAVNQRIFDVPATGAFVLTDWREQIENLFEPGKEVVCFHSPDEVPELIERYLKHPAEREKISQAARKRVLSQHRYENRMQTVIETMRKTFG